jgi:hypothetical protein
VTQSETFILRDVESGEVYPVPIEGMSIGRVSANTITLDDDQVSRVHAKVWAHEGQLYLQDDESTNGTLLNETKITDVQMLRPGDRIRIGSAVFEVGQQVVAQPDVPAEQPSRPAGRGVPLVPLVIAGGVVVLILVGLLFRQFSGTGAEALPTPSPAVTEGVTATVVTVPTQAPTAEVSTPVPTDMPRPAQPAASPTPGISYAAPTLISPHENGHYAGVSPIPYPELTWSSVGTLGPDEYYHVTIDYNHSDGIYQENGFTKDVRWRVPDYLYSLLVTPRECHWSVEVVQATETDADGNPTEFVPVSPPSETRVFTWLEGSGGGGGNGGGDNGGGDSPLPTPRS